MMFFIVIIMEGEVEVFPNIAGGLMVIAFGFANLAVQVLKVFL